MRTIIGCKCTWVVMMGEEHRFYSPDCRVHVEGQVEARQYIPGELTVSPGVKLKPRPSTTSAIPSPSDTTKVEQ